jgi:hypothetical protein
MHTTIDHDVRRKFDLTLNEYAICDSIYYLSRDGHCTASKKYLGEFIGIKERAVFGIIKKLKTIGLIESTKLGLKTKVIWNCTVQKMHTGIDDYAESADDYAKSAGQTMQKVQADYAKSAYNNNNITTINKDINILRPIGAENELTPHSAIKLLFRKYSSEVNNGIEYYHDGKQASAIKKLESRYESNYNIFVQQLDKFKFMKLKCNHDYQISKLEFTPHEFLHKWNMIASYNFERHVPVMFSQRSVFLEGMPDAMRDEIIKMSDENKQKRLENENKRICNQTGNSL